jgi:hypothetical protein
MTSSSRRRSLVLPRSRFVLAVLAALLGATTWSGVAHAQPSPSGTPSDTPLPPDEDQQPPTEPPPEAYGLKPDPLIDTSIRRSWNEGRARPFLATTLDVGWTYVRPRASLGYGKPFGTWFGIDLNPIFSGNGIGAYGGVRVALPRLDIRFGPRYFVSFLREYLNPQRSYNRLDLDSTLGDPARILTYEAEAEFSLPVGPGDVVGLGSISYVTGVPEGQYVFEETLRVIVAPPIVWRARGGYVIRFGSARQHSLGIVADFLDVPKRDDSKTVRFGPVIRIVLSRRVEVRGSFVPTILSPDHIGLVGGDFTELGFRYRWATE